MVFDIGDGEEADDGPRTTRLVVGLPYLAHLGLERLIPQGVELTVGPFPVAGSRVEEGQDNLLLVLPVQTVEAPLYLASRLAHLAAFLVGILLEQCGDGRISLSNFIAYHSRVSF